MDAWLLHIRTARRLLRGRRPRLRDGFAPLSDRPVFVVGSPRSGTTFLGAAIGSLPGFTSLGEANAYKAAIPRLVRLPAAEAAREIRRILTRTCRLGLVGSSRFVDTTPESAFVVPAIAAAWPNAVILHLVRDGRDVACSLLERGWLSAGRSGRDDTGLAYGPAARFWVEQGGEAEFSGASDIRRAAWAWRRYVSAARSASELVHELRYERLVQDGRPVADELAELLGVPIEPVREALAAAHSSSVGRHSTGLSREQLAEVETEAGPLLAELGYLDATS